MPKTILCHSWSAALALLMLGACTDDSGRTDEVGDTETSTSGDTTDTTDSSESSTTDSSTTDAGGT